MLPLRLFENNYSNIPIIQQIKNPANVGLDKILYLKASWKTMNGF